MIAKIGYSSVYHYVWDIGSIEEIFPDMIKPLLLFSALGGLVVFRAKGGEMKRVLFFLYCIFIAFFLYCISSYIGVTDIRFIPFLQLFLVFPSAYSIGWFACKIGDVGRMRRHPIVSSIVAVAILVLVVASTMHFVSSNEKYIPFWIKWNYGGFETKENWQQLQNITSYLQSLPQARIVHEYSASHDKFGTPRTFESIPLFSGKPVLEGLNIESALTAPHVFVIQSEISITPTCPIPGLVCSKFDIRNATIHLRQFNVRYVVATTSQLKEALRMDGNYKSLATFDEIEIFELEPDERTGYASVAKYEPVLVQANGNEWKQYSLDWFRSASEVPLVFTSGISEADRARFATIYEYGEFQIGESKLPQYAIENCNISENVQNEAIELQLDGKCINKPVIVRVPYFPNWKVEGADRIYLVSPAFMLIYPQQSNVRIYYSYTSVDYAGMILTAVGMVVLIVVSLPAFGSLKFFLKFFPKPEF